MTARSSRRQALLHLSGLAVAGTLALTARQGLAQSPAPVTATADSQQEDLLTAARRDHGWRVERLLSEGVDPNVRGSDGQTPMTLALQLGNESAFNALMASPLTNAAYLNANGESPLMLAAIRGNFDAVKRLLAVGAHVNRQGWSPLLYAAAGTSDHQAEIVQLLLEKGADINSRSPNGTTPLMMAAEYGTDRVAALLMKKGANAELKNELGLNATDFAKRVGRDTLADEISRFARKQGGAHGRPAR